MPLSVALVGASIWAVGIFNGRDLRTRLEVMSRSAGHANIIYMIWIFILAGAFASLAKEIGSVDATVEFALSVVPVRWIIPGLFVAACFISMALGTSVGTIVALAPLAAELSTTSSSAVAFNIAVVLGGAFFGDNLSFISDTTIAATRSQGCEMSDKFKANIKITLPAALATLALYMAEPIEVTANIGQQSVHSPGLIVPYITVILLAVARVNVNIVLICGIVCSLVFGYIFGQNSLTMMGYLGSGIDSMGNLIIITMLSAGMLGVIKAMGGIKWLLQCISAKINSRRGAEACIATLVGVVNLCTANNTVAIITVGDMSREIAQTYDIAPRKCASLLDTCSCIVQCLIPYGAQTLLATSIAGISPIAPLPYLYYPLALAIMVALSIMVRDRR